MLCPGDVCSVKSVKLKRANPESDEHGRMQRYRIGLQRAALHVPRSLLAAAVGGRHLHLSALTLHHAAAGAFLSRHLRVRSHTRHSRGHTDHQQQQNRSELAQKLHLIEEYAAPRDATTGTTNIRLALAHLPGIRVVPGVPTQAWSAGAVMMTLDITASPCPRCSPRCPEPRTRTRDISTFPMSTRLLMRRTAALPRGNRKLSRAARPGVLDW
jgi:hypothetical protein